MKAQRFHSIKLLAMVIPGIFLLVMISSPLLSQDIFYKSGYADPQWFYENFCAKTCTTPGQGSSNPPNRNFYRDEMYFPWLDSAGFNTVFGAMNVDNSVGLDSGDWRLATWYRGIKLFVHFDSVYEYGQAQYKMYGVGDELLDVFQEPCSSGVGYVRTDDEEPIPYPSIFYSDTSEHHAGYLINQFTWGGYQRHDREYTMEMRAKYRNPKNSHAEIFRARFGKDDPGIDDWDTYYPSHQWLFYPDSSPWSGTDDNMSDWAVFTADSFAQVGVYDTLRMTHTFGGHRVPSRIEIFWSDSADFYLDWIRVYDQEYYNCVLERSNRLDLAMEK